MRCPKCHYLGFDSGERCRNCGYDFSLALDPVEPADLPIREPEPTPSAPDLGLAEFSVTPLPQEARRSYAEFDLDLPRRPAPPSGELPLFTGQPVVERPRPVIAPPAARAPLSVRRGTPEVVRLRAKPARRPDGEELELDLDPAPRPASSDAAERERAEDTSREEVAASGAAAGVLDRVTAGLIDLTLLAAIDAVVLYLTLRLAGLTYAEWRVLPLPPLAGFYAMLNGGYFVTFTAAGGQTIGKMLRRIRVVSRDGTLHASQVILRTAAYAASALPAGLGFAAGMFGAEHLALHDRLADTRVVKVIAAH
jgi:uncharacterized RDD family membrane protein YckC